MIRLQFFSKLMQIGNFFNQAVLPLSKLRFIQVSINVALPVVINFLAVLYFEKQLFEEKSLLHDRDST